MGGLVAGLDYDISAEAVGMPLQENQLPPRPRMRPEDTAHIDMRIRPESRPRALKHLAAIRDRLSQPKNTKNQALEQSKQDIQRKSRLFEMVGDEAKQAGERARGLLFGEVA